MTEKVSVPFDGHVYRSESNVFEDVQESGRQNVRFYLQRMHIEVVLAEFGEYASDDDFWVKGGSEKGVMLLAAKHAGDICLELCLSPGFETVKFYASYNPVSV